jgi:hypothetical protein
VAVYLKDGERLRSLTGFFTIEELRQMLGHGYLLQPGDETREIFQRAIDRLWASGDAENLLPVIRGLLDRMFPARQTISPAERQAIVEEHMLAVYLHSHMDEDTFDAARVAVCPDQVPDSEGRLIPACAYNLFYRQNDPRFWFPGGCGSGHKR